MQLNYMEGKMQREYTEFTQAPPLYEVGELPGGMAAIYLYDEAKRIETTEDAAQRWRAICYTIVTPNVPGLMQRVGKSAPAWLAKAKALAEAEARKNARARRDRLLRDCDYAASMDYPATDAERDAWRTYRQALRDVPEQAGFPWEISWPVMPKREKSGE